MTALRVKRYDGLAQLPPHCKQLLEDAARDSLFLSAPWFENFERHVPAEGARTRIYAVESAAADGSGAAEATSRAVALLVCRLSSPAGEARRLASLVNYYTPYFDIACPDAAQRPAAVRALVDALCEDRRDWDVVDLQPLADPGAAPTRALVDALRAAGLPVQTYYGFGNWYLEVGGRSFDEYLAGLSSVLKKNVPYATRRLERTPGSRIEIVTDIAGLERVLPHYETVYNASWKVPEPHPQFIHAVARSAAERGWLRLGMIYVEDQPAAAQLWFVVGGTASIFKIAYDERFAKLSVGTVLTAHLMRHAIDVDRVTCVDYLSGDDDYKKNWMSHRRERWGVLAFNPRSVRGLALAARKIGGRRVLGVLKGLRQRFRPAPAGQPSAKT